MSGTTAVTDKAGPPVASADRRRPATGPSRRQARFRATLTLFLMGLPALALLFVFNYIPLAGTVMAFKDYRAARGVFGSKWVGLENFKFLFASGDALHITLNTVFMNALIIAANLIMSLVLALL